jgi:hypothetical protein
MKKTAIDCFWGNRTIKKQRLSKRPSVGDGESDGSDGSEGETMPSLFPFPISLKSDNKIYLNENQSIPLKN